MIISDERLQKDQGPFPGNSLGPFSGKTRSPSMQPLMVCVKSSYHTNSNYSVQMKNSAVNLAETLIDK